MRFHNWNFCSLKLTKAFMLPYFTHAKFKHFCDHTVIQTRGDSLWESQRCMLPTAEVVFQSMCSDSLATQFRGCHPSLKDPYKVQFVSSNLQRTPPQKNENNPMKCLWVFGSWPLRFHVDSSCRGPIVLWVLIREIALRALIFFLFRRLISPEIRKNPGKDAFYLFIYIHIPWASSTIKKTVFTEPLFF